MDWYDNLRAWFQGFVGPAAAPVQVAVPEVATTTGASRMFGARREKKGCTSTGAKKCSTRRR